MSRRARSGGAKQGKRPRAARPRRRKATIGMVVGIMVILVIAGALAWFAARLSNGSNGASDVTSTPTIDPRLIVRARTQAVSGLLGGSISLTGTIYPTLPGTNTVTLRLARGSPIHDGSLLRVVLTMPGMSMAPVHATLRAQKNTFQGHVYIPMFGVYQAKLDTTIAARSVQGTMRIIVTF